MGVENGVEDDVAKLNLSDPGILPPPPGGGGFSFANAPVGGAPAAGGFSFNLQPPAPPAAGGAADEDNEDDEDDEDDEDEGLALPREVLGRVLGLKALHDEREAAMADYVAARAALDLKFRAVFDPIYAKRAQIVKGEVEPELAPEDSATLDTAGAAPEAGDAPIRGVPDFWLSALGRLPEFNEAFLEEPDVDALKFLTDVRCVDEADLSGFTLEFEFAPNPFFANAVLTKAYEIPNLVDANGQPELASITGCDVEWKDARDNLCFHEVKKKQKAKRGKNAGQTRVVTKVEKKPSFFHFFESIKLPPDDDDDDGDDADYDDARERIDADVDLAFKLRHDVVPKAILYFTGEAVDSDDEDFYPGESDDDDDDDE